MATNQPTCGALVGLWIAVEYDGTWCRGLVKQHVATKVGDNYLVRTPHTTLHHCRLTRGSAQIQWELEPGDASWVDKLWVDEYKMVDPPPHKGVDNIKGKFS